jgi:hypothetical protein
MANRTSSYRVLASRLEDTDKGWVWASLGKQFQSRTSIRITRKVRTRKWSVYCEYREIDANLVKLYDGNENSECMYFANHRDAIASKRKDVDLGKLGNVAVVSSWYRKALGDFETSKRSGRLEELLFDDPYWSWWRDLRAACQHPEPGVRVATKVAILGTWLGVSGLLLGVAEPVGSWLRTHGIPHPVVIMPSLCIVSLILCLLAARGVRQPKRNQDHHP